jgi:GNAT superfamily N-acetyltransferase
VNSCCLWHPDQMTQPLTADRVEEALGMMERFYREMNLEFVRERAGRALHGLDGFGGWWFIAQDGQPAGYFVLTVGYSLEFGGRFALLDEFYLEPEWRGKGLGSGVMDRILTEARALGAEALHLEAEGHVREFYRRSGFVARGREMMSRWLTPERI